MQDFTLHNNFKSETKNSPFWNCSRKFPHFVKKALQQKLKHLSYIPFCKPLLEVLQLHCLLLELSDKENLKPDQDLKVTLLNSFLVKAKVLPRLLLLFHPGLFIHTTKHVNTFHGLVYLTPIILKSDSLQYSEETLHSRFN